MFSACETREFENQRSVEKEEPKKLDVSLEQVNSLHGIRKSDTCRPKFGFSIISVCNRIMQEETYFLDEQK